MSNATSFYQGKAGVVTGSAAGIGRAMALAFAAAGARLMVITDKNIAGGEETVAMIKSAGGEAQFMKVDVSRERDVEAMVEKIVADYGSLDFAVNNAAVEGEAPNLDDCTEEQFDRLIAVNVKGVFLCMKHQIRQMRRQGKGAIVNIGSPNSFRPQPTMSLYTTSKFALIGLTRNAAVDCAAAGIRINAIIPGAIATPMLDAALSRMGIPYEELIPRLSLNNRCGLPEEVAKAALWLCSDDSSYTYGHSLAVEGGYLIR